MTAANPRETKTHTGVVLGMGAPSLTKGGAEVPQGFVVGDVVQYHFEHHQAAATRVWTDGKLAHVVPQWCVDAVWDAEDVGSVAPNLGLN
jgi:hypothetical protein